jgi:hypothetical protein
MPLISQQLPGNRSVFIKLELQQDESRAIDFNLRTRHRCSAERAHMRHEIFSLISSDHGAGRIVSQHLEFQQRRRSWVRIRQQKFVHDMLFAVRAEKCFGARIWRRNDDWREVVDRAQGTSSEQHK